MHRFGFIFRSVTTESLSAMDPRPKNCTTVKRRPSLPAPCDVNEFAVLRLSLRKTTTREEDLHEMAGTQVRLPVSVSSSSELIASTCTTFVHFYMVSHRSRSSCSLVSDSDDRCEGGCLFPSALTKTTGTATAVVLVVL